MSEILSLEQIEDEIGMLVRGGGDSDRVLRQFMALRSENERLKEALRTEREWHEAQIGNEAVGDVMHRERIAVLAEVARG